MVDLRNLQGGGIEEQPGNVFLGSISEELREGEKVRQSIQEA
jgi:hypothetical protein